VDDGIALNVAQQEGFVSLGCPSGQSEVFHRVYILGHDSTSRKECDLLYLWYRVLGHGYCAKERDLSMVRKPVPRQLQHHARGTGRKNETWRRSDAFMDHFRRRADYN
jgi:hypothetical protein